MTDKIEKDRKEWRNSYYATEFSNDFEMFTGRFFSEYWNYAQDVSVIEFNLKGYNMVQRKICIK